MLAVLQARCMSVRALTRRGACVRVLLLHMQALLALDASTATPAAMLLLPRRAWRGARPLAFGGPGRCAKL
jgi:hypothetical protein